MSSSGDLKGLTQVGLSEEWTLYWSHDQLRRNLRFGQHILDKYLAEGKGPMPSLYYERDDRVALSKLMDLLEN